MTTPEERKAFLRYMRERIIRRKVRRGESLAPEEREEYIQICKEWIARRKARVDQLEKKYEDQYPFFPPHINHKRLIDLEARRFEIEINETELNEFINWPDEGEGES